MMDVKPLVVIDNKTKNGVKNAIEILKEEMHKIRDQKLNSSKNEYIQTRLTEHMMSYLLAIEHLKEVLRDRDKVNK